MTQYSPVPLPIDADPVVDNAKDFGGFGGTHRRGRTEKDTMPL
jgi:hypothetical protein